MTRGDDEDRADRPSDDDPISGPVDGDASGGAPASTDALAAALMHALAPGEIDDDVNERLIAAALATGASASAAMAHGSASAAVRGSSTEVDERPATRAEERDAAALRDALAAPPASLALRTDDAARLAGLARALRFAYAPVGIDELRNQAILRHALGPRRTQRVAVFATLVAAAAAFVFFVARPGGEPDGPPRASASLIPSRSTQDLFDPAEPFPREGGTTERIDKIAEGRGRDVRQNRFAAWGVE